MLVVRKLTLLLSLTSLRLAKFGHPHDPLSLVSLILGSTLMPRCMVLRSCKKLLQTDLFERCTKTSLRFR